MMIYIILLIGLFLRIINLNRDFWFGETTSLLLAKSSPSFSYFFLHYLLKLDVYHEWFLRLPNVVFALATIYIVYLVIDLIAPTTNLMVGKKKISLSTLIAFLLAINPFHIYYSQALESYCLYLLLLLTLLFFFLKLLKTKYQHFYKKIFPIYLAYSFLFTILISSYLVFGYTPKVVQEDWQKAFAYLNNQNLPDSQTIFAYDGIFPPAAWYQPNLPYLSPLGDLDEDPSALDLRLNSGTLGKRDVYYFRYLELTTDPNKNITTWLSNAGYTLIDTISFNGIGPVDHYRAN